MAQKVPVAGDAPFCYGEQMNIQTKIEAEDAYHADFTAWLLEQAARLRARDADALDWDNLAEEIESLGRSEARELTNRLTVLLEHLVKYEHGLNREPAFGWTRTIVEQRRSIEDILKDSPSLRRRVPEFSRTAYARARADAVSSFVHYEPNRAQHYESTVPASLPYGTEDLLDEGFMPVAQKR